MKRYSVVVSDTAEKEVKNKKRVLIAELDDD